MDEKICYSKKELKEIQLGVNSCIKNLIKKQTPFSISIKAVDYFDYVAKYKSEIINFLPFSYLTFYHRHKDTYVHFGELKTLKKIVKEGYLTNEYSDDFATLGKGIYTFPLKSGMFFYNNRVKDYGFLIFETDAEHNHIVQTDDTSYAIGESDFLCKKIKIENPRIITSLKEMEDLSKENFDWELARREYYGLVSNDMATLENMWDIIDYYNDNYKPMKKEEKE